MNYYQKTMQGFLRIVSLIGSFLILSCKNNSSINQNEFDPMSPAGGLTESPELGTSSETHIKPGEFVSVNLPNTGFYKKRPEHTADADMLLQLGTYLKVISVDKSYSKVELDSGEVGWVSTIMINLPSNSSNQANDLELQSSDMPTEQEIDALLLPSTDENAELIPAIIDPNESISETADPNVTIPGIPDPNKISQEIPTLTPP